MSHRYGSSQRHGRERHVAHKGEYTIGHAGRQFRLGPVAFWITVSVLVIMACWTAGTATYFAFRDDVLTRLLARQAEMQYAYEDRITELRAQIDRVTSRQLLDQDKVEQRVDQITRRQAVLESRASALAGLPDALATGSVRSNGRPGGRADTPATLKPTPVGETLPLDRRSSLDGSAAGSRGRNNTAVLKGKGLEATLARVEESLGRMEARQAASLAALEETFESKARRMRGVLTDIGVDPGKPPSLPLPAATGGPFVPVALRADGGAFERQLHRIQLAYAHMERLQLTLVAIPLRQPLPGELDTTSGFGVRLDPFIRAPAMHSGLDFRASTGEPVRATAAGKVESTGWSGGYGKLVEIDHGNGFSTRYGHLSEILVREGETIRPGQIIGRVGSTGRSTGPHLHYETRIDGEAVDPNKFLRAGLRLGEKL
jgi:murein DD-endopeptidase MepM/ murein hydrolase activator NlpD